MPDKQVDSQVESKTTTPDSQAESTPSSLTLEAALKELESTRKEAAKYRTKLKSIEDAQSAREAEDAAKRGEFESLYKKEAERAKSLEAQVSAFQAVQQEELTGILSSFKDEDKELISEELPVAEKLKLARKLQARLSAQPKLPGVTGVNGQREGKFGGYESELDWAKAEPKQYLEYVKSKKH